MSDNFLGTWNVQEHVYAPSGELCGVIQQRRELHEDKLGIKVSQFCQASESLRTHPMGAFSGEFLFRLARDGQQRLYKGPDVEGYGTSWGDIFLSGEGVWPRFGFNFRSWSIRVSETRQLTGGVFFRGCGVAAFIVGVGTLEGSQEGPLDLDLRISRSWAEGAIHRYDFLSETASSSPLLRQQDEDHVWLETYEGAPDHWRRELKGDAAFLTRQQRGAQTVQRGFARAYGPALIWDIYGNDGRSSAGIDIYDSHTQEQFSIRRNYLHGRLVSLEGLQCGE